MTEQGSPPRRPARQPDLGRHGYDREPDQIAEPEWDQGPVDEQAPGWDRLADDREPASEHAFQQAPGRHQDRALEPDHALYAEPAPAPNGGPHRARVHRPERPRRVERPRPSVWDRDDAFEETDSGLPPWAGLSVHPVRAGGTQLRPPAEPEADGQQEAEAPPDDAGRPGRRSGRRAAATRLRKSRRRVVRWSGAAIVACVVVAVVAIIVTNHPAKPLPYVTSLLPGEFKSVPDACTAVSPAVLNQYLPGAGRTTVASVTTSSDNGCSFTVDSKPNFLVLSVGSQSYQPFAAATGNGSASDNAADNFTADRQALVRPPKKSPLSPAVVTPLPGLGKRAFVAVAHEHVGRIINDVVTVCILERNVIITVSMSAQESGGFGPAPLATLQAGAQAAAKDVLAKARTQPTA